LTPFLARSVGFVPVFFPPEGCLGHAPVQAQPGPVDALQAVVVQQPQLPQREEDTGLDPLLEAVVGGGTGTILGGIEGFPLTAGAQDEEDGIGTDPIGSAWAAAPEAVGVHMPGDADFHDLPHRVGEAPVVGNWRRFHDSSSCDILI
jgi:hypothetical protein